MKENKNPAGRRTAIGIDIGTTTISATVFDLKEKKQSVAHSLPHRSYVLAEGRSEQDVSVILGVAEGLLARLLNDYPDAACIGVTGQMHGIVYVNASGEAVSNLINWQDKRADEPLSDGQSACEQIRARTGEVIATGYGLATHYHCLQTGTVPSGAVSFCSIMDLLARRITGEARTVIHASVAASFGLFDVQKGAFRADALRALGVDPTFLPEVTGESRVIGVCRGIPVAVPIGDNQASVLGSVDENGACVLVNVGTGSQVSAVSEYRAVTGDVELRPFIEGKHLICGSALCGGFAYGMLERFFREYAVGAGLPDASQYDVINRLAAEAYERGERWLDVDTCFAGKRSDPDRRGAIFGIDRQNFTPSALILGVLRGMCDELYGLYRGFGEKKTRIVASGGAIKRNDILQRVMADRFGLPLSLLAAEEEAAVGAALFAALAAGEIRYDDGFGTYIAYA